jgi:DnaJ-class molecular chaperone
VRLAVQGNLGEPGKPIDEVQIDYPDLYNLLGVTYYANDEQIRKAYHLEARRWHPDLNSSPEAAEHFQTLTKAYEVLRDPKLRTRYDERFGEERAA